MISFDAPLQPESGALLEKLREELRTCEARFRSVINRHPEGIVVLDAQGMVFFANPAALRLMSQPPDIFFRSINWQKGVGQPIIYETKVGGKNAVYEIKVIETEWDLKQAFLISLRDISPQKDKELNLQRAVDEAEARTAELEIMRFVADQLNQAALLEETIQSGLEMIQTLSGAKKIWVILADGNSVPHLVVIDHQVTKNADHQNLLEMPQNCSCLNKMLAGELKVATHISNCEWADPIFGSDYANSSHYSFPLYTGSKVIGVLNLAVEADKVYSQNEINLLETVSHELAAAIERGRMLSETSEALRRDAGVNQISRTLSSTLDLTTVLQNVVHLASDLIGAEVGLLGLLSQDRSTLTFPFHFGLAPEIELPALPQKECLIWKMMTRCESQLELNFQGELPELPTSLSGKVNAIIATPIIGNDRCLGVISLYKTTRDRLFTNFDLSMLESLGRQAGLAINNAELYFEVQQLTTSDGLTGINNRLAFINLAVKEVERSWRYKRPLSLIIVDIDSLKAFNKTYGYESGNDALRIVAHICSNGLRRVDILARMQDDELVLLLPETDLKNATDVAERLRLQIATTPLQTDKGNSAITVSMGIASVDGLQEIDLQTLLDRAEMALFEAKQNGRKPGSDLEIGIKIASRSHSS